MERQLHPREESYRWAIEKLDHAFGAEHVRITPRNHYHVITAAVFNGSGDRAVELALRNPTYDLNKKKDREKYLDKWIAETREKLAGGKSR
ncbi:MAG TPA: hypothetical protein VOA87_00450 [Thermoanaerobaculia bacterium]|nr:hypothetical protein [Thermoanaerobaculia bacterium]